MTLCSVGPRAIERLDAREVLVDERPRRVLPGLHPLLQVGDRRFLEIEGATAAAPARGERDRPTTAIARRPGWQSEAGMRR